MDWNTLKTTILLGFLTGILLMFGKLLGGNVGLVIALVMAAIMNFGSWYFSDKIVLFMYGVRLLEKDEAPVLHEMVERLAEHNEIVPKILSKTMEIDLAFAEDNKQLKTIEKHAFDNGAKVAINGGQIIR